VTCITCLSTVALSPTVAPQPGPAERSERPSDAEATGRRARGAHLGHSAQGCGKVLAFSHRGDGVRLLEFAADLRSSHDVCRPQGSCTERIAEGWLRMPRAQGLGAQALVSNSFVRFAGEL
jgi:hypothetical protein